jgi:hypothetical protein
MDRLLSVTTALSVILLLMVLFSIRRQHIRVEYSMSWLLAAGGLLALSRCRPALDFVATHIGLGVDSPLALFLIGGSVFLIMFFRYSMIVSHLRDDNIALAQRVAILEFHIQNLSADLNVGLKVDSGKNG